jgi:type III secretory pathway component EscR
LGLLLGFLAGLLVFKEVFDVGWFRAFLIAVLAYLVFIVIAALISMILIPFVPAGQLIRGF